MEIFEYVAVLTSIIIGLGMAQYKKKYDEDLTQWKYSSM